MAVAIRTATRIQDQDDAPALGAGQDGYALTWNNATGAFVATALVTDHGALSGLSDDDHTGYALLAGRAGGQTLYGGDAANDDITIHGTSDATRTTSYVILQPTAGNVGIGTTSPNQKLEINTGNIRISRATPNPGDEFGNINAYSTSGAVEAAKISFIRNIDAADHNFGTITFSTGTYGNVLAETMRITSGKGYLEPGYVGIGTTAPASRLHVIGENSLNTSFAGNISGATGTGLVITNAGNVGIGTTAPATLLHGLLTSAATNAVTNVVTIGHDTSGTAAAGFGAGLLFQLESSTTAGQSAARIQVLWNDATHASRKADLVLTAYDTAEREGLRIRGAGSEPAIGFYGVAPIARAVLATGAGASVDDVITALQNLGLVKQS